MTSQLERECNRAPRVTATFDFGKAKGDCWDEAWEHNNYRVTLRHQGRRLAVDFFTGSMFGEPNVADVLSSLLSEAWESDSTFEDYCAEFGLDPDSRKVYAQWQAIVAQGRKVRKFLGDSFERFAHCEH